MIPEHVMSWAKKPGPARLLAEIRSRREQGALGPRSLIKLELTDGERREIGQMLSVRWQLSAQPLRLGELQSGLAGHGVDLDELLEACGGPLRNLRDERAAARLSKQADQSAGTSDPARGRAERAGRGGDPLSGRCDRVDATGSGDRPRS